MQIQKLKIQGLVKIECRVFGDERGFFTERFKKDWADELGLPEFVQENYSRSAYGVIRGLHYQFTPPQGKLVTCTRGRLLDVATDIRKGSPTYGQTEAVVLDGALPAWFWIPAGFAHGFQVLSEEGADLLYKTSAVYSAAGEGSIHWADADLKVPWVTQGTSPLLSGKDQQAQSFKEYSLKPVF